MVAAVAQPRSGAGSVGEVQHPSGARWERAALAFFAVVAVAVASILLHRGHGLTFYFDEWDFVQRRRDWDADALLGDHNGHLSLVPALVYKLLFEAVGLWTYVPYRAVGLIAHLAVVGVVFAFARKRLGALPALAPAAMILCFGPGWADILWPFQIGFLIPLAAGLASFTALDRDDEAGEVQAAALLVVALCAGSIGIPFLAAVALEILFSPDRLRRLWIVGLPAALYALWYLVESPASQLDFARAGEVPEFVWRSAAGSVGALLSSGVTVGAFALAVLVPLMVWRLYRMRRAPPRVLALLAAPLILWTLTAFARAGIESPTASRYLYPGAVMVLMIAVELARGVRWPGWALGVASIAVIVSLMANWHAMNRGFVDLRYATELTRGALAGLELAGPSVDPGLYPEQAAAPQVRADLYLAAVRQLGSPAPAFDALSGEPLLTRVAVDRTLIKAYRLDALSPAVGAVGEDAPKVIDAGGTRVEPIPGCAFFRKLSGGAAPVVELPRTGIIVDEHGPGRWTLQLRRFAPDFVPEVPEIRLEPDVPVLLLPPDDPAREPWVVRINATRHTSACGAP